MYLPPANEITGKMFHSCPSALADLGGGVRDARPPLGVQILSISCSFRENLACSRPPWRVHAPPSGKSWIRHWSVIISVHRESSCGYAWTCSNLFTWGSILTYVQICLLRKAGSWSLTERSSCFQQCSTPQ